MTSRTGDIHFRRSEHASFMPRRADRRLPRAIGPSRIRHAAWAFLRSFGRRARAFVAEVRARRAISFFRSLDDYQLQDLGIRRQDIEDFVRSRCDERWEPRTARVAPRQTVATARRMDGHKPAGRGCDSL